MKTHQEFQKAYNNSKKWHSDFFVSFYMPQNGRFVGFTASKKVGKAVIRNRAKRRLKALFIKYRDILKDGIFVFVAKTVTADADFLLLEKNFLYSLKKLNAIK